MLTPRPPLDPALESLADLPPGAEMDRAVASRIFGWMVKTLKHVDLMGDRSREWVGNYYVSPGETFPPTAEGFMEVSFDPQAQDLCNNPPAYSTDQARALEVHAWVRTLPPPERARVAALIQRYATSRMAPEMVAIGMAPEMVAIGSPLAWATILIEAEPVDWCRAALRWTETIEVHARRA